MLGICCRGHFAFGIIRWEHVVGDTLLLGYYVGNLSSGTFCFWDNMLGIFCRVHFGLGGYHVGVIFSGTF